MGRAGAAGYWPRRCPVLALAAACGLILLMTAAVVEGFLLPQPHQQPPRPQQQQQQQWRPAGAAAAGAAKAQATSAAATEGLWWRPPAAGMGVGSSSRRQRVRCWSAAAGGSANTSGNDSPTRLDAATLEPPPTTTTTAGRASRRPSPAVRIPPPHEDDKPDVKLGVLLLQLGGPESTEDVEGFLYNLFADPDIIRLPGIISGLQKPLAYVISKRRAPKSKAAYESIGGGSPIVRYTQAQADGVEKVLKDMGLDAKCYVAMRYWHPFTDEALERMRADGVNSLVVVPLYPQFSISTSGSSLRVLQDLFFKDAPNWANVSHTVVPAWYDRPGYVQAMGRLIATELEQFSPEQRAEGPLHVLFSAHGVPQKYIEMGDPYQQQIQKCVELIAREYASPEVTTHLSYQSRVGPIEWLRPYTDDKLEELGASGVKNLVVVPISFVSEHIETLEEIDIEYRELAHENGITNWRRVPALNTDAGFIQDLANMVVEALQEPAITVTEACALNNLDIDPVSDGGGGGVDGKVAVIGLAASLFLDMLKGPSISHIMGMH